MGLGNRVISRRAFLSLGAAASGIVGLAACGARPGAPAEPSDEMIQAVQSAGSPSYDLEGGLVTLNNDIEMPTFGLGTYALSVDQAAESVYWAIEAQEAGKARCVGLSNFTDQQFADMVETTGVIPQVAQYEGHLHLQRHAAQGFLAQYGVQLEDWFPLGGKGNTDTYLNDPVVTAIAVEVERSAAQVIERWHLQEGRVIMPGLHNRDHIRENVALFDFALTDDL